MPLLRTLTTRRLITSLNIATAGIALLLASAAFVAQDIVTIRERSLRALTTAAEIVAYNAASALRFNDRDAAAATLKVLRADPQVVAAGIFKPDGIAFVTYARGDPSDAAALVNAAEGDGHRFIGDRLLLYRTISFNGEKVGSIRLLSAMQGVTASILRHLAIAALIFVAVGTLSLLVLRGLHQRASRPVMELIAKARAVADHNDYSLRAPTSGHDEIALLARTFNEILSQIERRNRQLDEAHYAPQPEAPRDELDQAHPVPVVDAVEPELEAVEPEVTSQAEVMEDLLEVLESLRATADLKGVRLQLVVDPRAIDIAIDSEQLQQILWNLLSNAIKSTPEGGRVQVVAHRMESHVEIAVKDTGRGIDPALLPHVSSDSVWRADADGLSFVRRLVAQHGGRVRVESTGEEHGTTLTVELPIARSSTGSEDDR